MTTRFDTITAYGTGPRLERIHLADGEGIAIRAVPGATVVAEVFASPGVTIPYRDVPVEVVRALIARHGGEQADQGRDWTIPALGVQDPVLAEIADLHARFKDGYTDDDIRSVFGRIHDAGGPYLVCVWDYADQYGFGGNSEFFAEKDGGNLFNVTPDIHLWLSGEQETTGPVDTWVCAPVPAPTDFPVSDDFHNFARIDR